MSRSATACRSASGRPCGRPDALRGIARSTSATHAEDATQLAFELDAYLLLANARFVISGGSAPIDRARLALERRLLSAAQTA